jgi:hypothetical protein
MKMIRREGKEDVEGVFGRHAGEGDMEKKLLA